MSNESVPDAVREFCLDHPDAPDVLAFEEAMGALAIAMLRFRPTS